MLTLEISGTFSISSSKYSPNSFNWSIEKSPDKLIFIIGINSAKFISCTVGSAGKSFGKSLSDLAASTLSFTFRKASVGVMLKSNFT